MGRYNPPTPTLVLEPSLESLQMLTRAIQTDLDEAIYLSGLKTRLNAIQCNTVTSAEQLFIKSSIATVAGRESMLSLSLEAMRINPNFNPTVSQEGVGEMVKSAIKAVVEKIKQFFAWVRGLFAKVFDRNKRKADECKEAKQSTSSVKENFEKAKDDLRKSGKSMEDAIKEMGSSSDNLDKAMNDLHQKTGTEKKTYTDDEMETLRSKIKSERVAMLKLIRLSREGLVSAKGDQFVVRKSTSWPFKSSAEYVDFQKFTSSVLGQVVKDVAVATSQAANNPGFVTEVMRKGLEKLTSDRRFDKYFDDETGDDGLTTFKIKRDHRGERELTFNVSDFDAMLDTSSTLLIDTNQDIKSILECESKLRAVIKLLIDAAGEDEEKTTSLAKLLKGWMKVMGLFTRTLRDISQIALYVADDCTKIVNTLR